MDEITNLLGASFQVSVDANNIYSPHPRQSDYKKKKSHSLDQNVRRQRYLEAQKQKRIDFKLHARKLALDEWSEDEDDDDEQKEVGDGMEVSEELAHVKPPKRYKDQLMLSEWLVEVPSDFEDNWRMVMCPIGRRNLVVAAKGRTTNYSKSGYRIDTFTSYLPGGNKHSPNGYTLLDCIYCQMEKTFYILDVMCWNQHPVYDCETEFRFFWLQSKMDELEIEEAIGPYKFKVLPKCKCSKLEMENMLDQGLSKTTDGILFYHSKSYYLFGTTPLVLWLKPSMLHEMLGLKVPDIEGSSDVNLEQT